MSLKKVVGCFCLVLIISCSSSKNRFPSTEETKWKLVKADKRNDELSWKIFSRQLSNSNLYEYKIEGDVKSTQKECISSFRDEIYYQANKEKNKKYPTYDILNDSKECILTYVIHNEPFIFKDTEMRVRYTFLTNNESNTEEVKWVEAWSEDSVPPVSKKLSRVQTFRGAWRFSGIQENISKAINIVQFDPKGMPMWLVRPMVTKFLRKGLENIRESTTN